MNIEKQKKTFLGKLLYCPQRKVLRKDWPSSGKAGFKAASSSAVY